MLSPGRFISVESVGHFIHMMKYFILIGSVCFVRATLLKNLFQEQNCNGGLRFQRMNETLYLYHNHSP